MSNINLVKKSVGEIKGIFFLPRYQRGYRWSHEVDMLLNDISEIPGGENYCLQPIVIKKIADDKYELIDGQQRLTTIFLLLQYMKHLKLPFQPNFALEYEKDTSDDADNNSFSAFLNNIDGSVLEIADEDINNIDKFYVIKAFKKIAEWFQNQGNEVNIAINIYNKFNNENKDKDRIDVIWYEVDTNEESEALFTRLNIGRIPLTNAELVRALFLSRKSGIDDAKQNEIAMQWDNIEREMRNDNFWYFLTNSNPEDYPTRIELIFDLMAGKSQQNKEKFYTFFHFTDKTKEYGIENAWTKILRCYQRIKGWYEVADLYHKIGYLIASETTEMGSLIEKSENRTKSEFEKLLDLDIANSIKINKDYLDLSYENKDDYKSIERILLLFNVETIRKTKIRFPFDKHKNENWTLEHIHARRSQGLNKKEQWHKWLEEHKKSLESIAQEENKELLADVTNAIADDKLTREKFEILSERGAAALSESNEDSEYIHSLSNMALLGLADNATLNNSAFSVKRCKFLEMDKTSEYIPECTRRVFLKYYTNSDSAHLHYWGQKDREGYLAEMVALLGKKYGFAISTPDKYVTDNETEDKQHE